MRTFILFGIVIFLVLYGIAAMKYPGGSQSDALHEGFDWVHNYWCNLLSEDAVNGEINSGRPFALAGMFALCLALACFFYFFPNFYTTGGNWDQIIRISGVLAMLSIFFVFTKYHDEITIGSTVLGLLTLIGIFKALHKNKAHNAIIYAVGVGLLLLVNNYIYYTKHYLFALPLLQKISFLCVLLWVIRITLSFKTEPNPNSISQ